MLVFINYFLSCEGKFYPVKKNTFKHLLLIAIFLVAASACSVEKRVHNKGYFVKWHSNTHLFHKDCHPEKEIAEIMIDQKESVGNITVQENLNQKNSEVLFPEIMTNEHQSLEKNEHSTIHDNEHALTVVNSEQLDKTESLNQKELNSKSNNSNYRADNELIINIVLTVLLLALLILFIYLAIPATGTMVYVWWGLAAVCAILFITQVIDLILW